MIFREGYRLSRVFKATAPQNVFKDNKITTSVYTKTNFIPLNLIKQLTKTSNIYFLVTNRINIVFSNICKITGILQMISAISPTSDIPVMFFPLLLILLVNITRDYVEDTKRQKEDNEENSKIATKLKSKEIAVEIPQLEIRVGELIRIESGEMIPADCVIVGSSEQDLSCFLETKNLDGEISLKMKSTSREFRKSEYLFDDFFIYDCIFEAESPNFNLYQFNGTLKIRGELFPFTNENFLPRGAVIRNTKWVIGLVVYTGHETKMFLNSRVSVNKISSVEKKCEKFLIVSAVMQILISLIASILNYAYLLSHEEVAENIFKITVPKGNRPIEVVLHNLVTFMRWMLLTTDFIPISFLATFEFLKYFQGYFLEREEVFKTENEKLRVQTSSLNEDLGQINYVFSDKTGTLTKNKMVFRMLFANGKKYGDLRNWGGSASDLYSYQVDKEVSSPNRQKMDLVDFEDQMIFQDLSRPGEKRENLLRIFEILTLCHSVIASREKNSQKVNFFSVTPDELAFVNFAKYCGFEFEGKDPSTGNYVIKTPDGEKYFSIKFTFPFTSDRKRMSVLVEDLQENKYLLLTKGADDVIEKRSSQCRFFSIEDLQDTITSYSRQGLRTMLLSYKEVSEQEFKKYTSKIENTENMTPYRRKEELNSVYEAMERNLIVVGATAVEDQLQENVAETIDALTQRDVCVWMLTGDKLETALNIAFSSQLISEEDEVLTVNNVEDFSKEGQIEEILKKSRKEGRISLIVKNRKFSSEENYGRKDLGNRKKLCMAISGEVLWVIVNEPEFKQDFIKILKNLDIVIAARVTPGQKAELVKLVKENVEGAKTLAIGDGANDVNMIITSDVGIAIYGKEGRQASRAADFSVSEFKHLGPLMIHFGVDMYKKNTDYALYSFYKNYLLIFPSIFYGFCSGFGGYISYDPLTFELFNSMFTFWPIFIYALLPSNKTVEESFEDVDEYKKYSVLGNKNLSMMLFFKNLLLATWHAFICFILIIQNLQTYGSSTTGGKIYGLYDFETVLILMIVLIAIIKVLTLEGALNKYVGLASLYCLLQTLLVIWLIGDFPSNRNYGAFSQAVKDPYVYVLMVLGIGMSNYVEFMLTYI